MTLTEFHSLFGNFISLMSSYPHMTKYPKPMGEIIYENMGSVGNSCSINDLYERIKTKYPKIEINKNIVSTQMSDLSINGPISSPYPKGKRFLKRIGRGMYEIL